MINCGIQFIRRGSGANLNLFRFAAMLFLLLLGVSESAWSTTTYYYTKGSVSVKTGSGTVYINTASPATSGSSTTSSTAATKSCDKTSTQNAEQTYYISAVPATDWRFDSWTLNNWSTNPSSTTATTTGKIKAASSTESSPSTATAQATFKQISIASANKTSVTLNPTDARTSCTDYTGSVTFTTTNDNTSTQIGTPSFGSKTGSGTWTASNSWTAGTSTVTYTFKGNGYYGGSGTASGSRNNSATLTLPTAGGTSSKSVTFTANFPALIIADGATDVVSPKGPTDDGVGAVTFDVTYFDGLFDISNTAISNATGGTWTLGSLNYEQTNTATGAGVVTVPFTFNAGGVTGDFSAKLTLTPAANTGASAKEVTLLAHVDDLSTNDASVTPLGGSAIEYATFAEALAAANASDGCTLKLLRDVEGITTSQEVKKTMTLDLNRYSLSGTLSSAGGLLKLNTAGKVLTITDTQSGGKISVSGNIDGRISAVDIQKGSLVLTKGDLIAENANTGTTQANIYCATVNLAASTAMSMTNGSITANRTGASGKYCYGIYCGGTGSTAAAVNLTGGTIEATFANGTYAEGVYSTGTSLIQNMNITATAKSYSYAIWLQDGHLALNGGTYTGTTSTNGARAIYTYTHPDTKNALAIQNATLNATAGTTDAKGLYCQSRTTTTTAEPTDANIILSNVTINSETLGTTDAYAIYTYDAGVCLLVNSGTYNATAKTTTATAIRSAGYTAVLGGMFNATATTTTARGLHVAGSIAAVKAGTFTAIAETDLANGADIESNGKLLAYGGTFKGHLNKIAASKYAIGANVKAGGTLEAQGGTFIGEAANSTLTAKQTSFACGVYGVDGNSTINMTNATMRGELLSTYLSNGDVSTWNGGAYGFYSRSTNPCGLTNCTINAVSAYQGGFGLRFANTPAEVRNCTVTVTTTYAYNYGIFTGGTCDLKVYNSNFNCTSGTTYGYGIYAYNGTTYAENCTINVTTQRTGATSAADCYLYGVNVNTGKTATLNGCTINATGSGQYSNNGYGVYVNGTADIEDCKVTVSNINSGAYAIGNTSNTTRIGVASGKFKATATSTGASTNGTAAAAKQQLYGGYYNTNNNLEKYLPSGYGVETLASTSAEYGEGYRYAIRPSTNLNPVCKIGSTPYYTLEEALEYVNKNSGTANTILMTANYTLPAGDYMLPANATLLIPKSGQASLETHPTRVYNSYSYPTCNLKLTFASGVHMDVLGKIQTGSTQSAIGQISQTVTTANNGMPTSSYGWLYLSEGSTITLENGSHLYAWGYVTGPGEIDAKRGSTVYEFFQIKDWRGGTCTGNMNNNSQKVFPLNQYYIQNIESPIKFRPGSAEKCDGTVNAGSNYRSFNDVKLIGKTNDGALFEMANEDMSEDTWVRKWYDAANDKQVYEINSSATMNSVSLKLYSYTFTSSNYVLPVTNNMKIHLLTGSMEITQNTELLPGAEIEVDKEATAYVKSGKSLYIFDIDEWNTFYTNEHTFPVPYSPSWAGSGKTCPRSRKVTEDAKVNVHGKFVVNGGIYTTAGGANIFSTNEDAGTIQFNVAATSGTSTVYVANNTSPSYTARASNSAYLKNGDGTYEHTGGTVAGKSWMYYDGKWNCWTETNCFGYDAQNHPYAKPAAYVQLASDVADANHLYHDAATGNRAFILEDDCTWWEVEPTPYDGNKYKCVDADYSGKYKYYEYVNNKWQEAVVTVTWKNGSTTLATYNKTLYGTHPTYLDANPKQNATSTEYYTWIGWAKGSTEGEFFAKDAELPFATENTTYYAIFETHKYSYAVVFKNYDGSVLQTSSWEAGQVPYYLSETDPVKPSTAAKVYTFTGWSPAFTAVTGAGQVYTAQFDAGTDRTYTVQWVNYNGTVLKEEQVVYGATPSAPATPTRPNDTYYTYTFDAWSPAVSAVSGNQTYTATYNYEKKVTKYAITFKNGSTTVYTQNLQDGETPVFGGTTPTKPADAQYTYTFDGWSATEGGAVLASLPAVSGAAKTYYAHFATTTNAYTIRWKSIDGKQLYETDENVPYGAAPTYNGSKPTKARQGATVFTFDGWSSSMGGNKIALPAVSSDATYYAHFSDDPVYTVTFDANGHGTAPAAQEVVLNQLVIEPADPAAAEWIFGGWYKEASCTNAWNFASDVVTANTTLYAKWTAAVASITADGTTYYKTIGDAFTAAKARTNPTITMLQDVALGASSVTYDGANTCTFDLNGHTISGTANRLLVVNNASATFTITDNSESKLGKWSMSTSSTAGAAFCAYLVSGTLKLEAGTIYLYTTSTGSNAVGVRVDGGEFIMNGGTVHTVATQKDRVAHGVQPLNSGLATINGGIVRAESANGVGSGMYVTGTITVNGGNFFVSGKTAYMVHASTITPTKVKIQGGYYNIDTNLSSCIVAHYHKKTLSETHPEYANGYRYTVDNVYTITWLDDEDNVIDYTEVAYGQTPTHSAISKISDGCWNFTFDAWTPAITSVTGDATYKASFTQNIIYYAITWQNIDGTPLKNPDQMTCSDNPTYPTYLYGVPEHPTYPLLYEFSGWKNSADDFYSKDAELPEPTADETYTAQYTSVLKLDVADEQTIAIDAIVDVTTVRVEGKLDVTSGSLTTEDLILEGTPSSSGEIMGAVTATRALFHFTQLGGFKAKTWYAVAVPWEVEVPAGKLGGVYLKKGDEYVQQTLGTTYDLIYYDGARRATGANKAWNYIEDDAAAEHIMYPGRAYMIYLASDADTIRFVRRIGAALQTTQLETKKYAVSPGVNPDYADWNGIANPATYHAYINVGATDNKGQVYNPDTKQYDLFDMSANKLVVGQPIFVQPFEETTIMANANSNAYKSLAQRRSKAWSAPLTRYELMLAASEADVTDRVIVRMDEDKEEDTYTVGQDLAKMGISSVVPQMWIDRYDSKMCINTVAGFAHTADYPLGIFAPKDGEYNLFIDDQPNDETMLYLTYDGEAIWNLSYGGYVTYLNKGTDTHYGLRIVAHKPQTPTGIEETTIQNGDPIRKVMVDGKVYIIRNGEIYSVTGQKTK